MALEVKFIGEEYSFPEDILEYIFMLNLVEDMQNSLMTSIYNKVYASSMSVIDDSELHDEMRKQASRIIERLCNKGIFSKTIDEYVFENKGYEQYCLVNKNSREAMIRFLSEQMTDFQKGLEHAYENAASNITGSGVRVFSNSALTLAATSAMEYSILKKQAKTADEQYQRELSAVSRKGEATKGKKVKEYLIKTYFPHMEQAIRLFVYSMMDRYITDLTTEGKFDPETLKYVNIKRSNNLLDNLTITGNKQAVLKEAFVACPFNESVYVHSADFDFFDDDAYATTQTFGLHQNVLNAFCNKIPPLTYPSNLCLFLESFKKYISLLCCYSAEGKHIYTALTSKYVSDIKKQYDHMKSFAEHTEECRDLADTLLKSSPQEISNKVSDMLRSIVSTDDFEKLIAICGYHNLLNEITPSSDQLCATTKDEVDTYYIAKIVENVKLIVNEKNVQAEMQAKAEEDARNASEAKKRRNIKISIIVCVASVLIIFSAMLIINRINKHKAYYNAYELLSTGQFQDAINIYISLGDYKDSSELVKEATYQMALSLLEDEEYSDAIAALENLINYKNSSELLESVRAQDQKYNEAVDLIASEQYEEAIKILNELEGYKDSSELLSIAQEKYLIKTTQNNIDFASTLLGKQTDKNNDIELTPEEYYFITSDTYLFGYAGIFQHGFTETGGANKIIDLMDWTTNEALTDSSVLINQLEELYGQISRIQTYADHPNTMLWESVSDYQWVLCWQNADDTVTIRWIINIE